MAKTPSKQNSPSEAEPLIHDEGTIMPESNDEATDKDAEIAQLKAQLDVEQRARQEAETRANKAERDADLSIRKSVANEAQAVAESNKNREPKVSIMPYGNMKRIDF